VSNSDPNSSPDGGSSDGESSVAVAELDERHAAALEVLQEALGDSLLDSHSAAGELWVRVSAQAWVELGMALRDRLDCRWLDFLSAIDWLPSPFGRDMDAEQDWPDQGPEPRDQTIETGVAGGDTRLQMLARVQSVGSEQLSVIAKADLDVERPCIATWIGVYAGANWHEREAAEMFGIDFEGHPDLRHIYLPSEFEGHPLRKDFPLLARRVKPWPGLVDVELMPDEADGGEDAS